MPRPRRSLAVLALALAVVAFPLGALASHDFGDVPDSNPFHADISALVASGVTSGCGGGNYCPSANVTREQMAAFLNRLGALAPGKTPVVNATKLDGLDSSQLLRSDVASAGRYTCGPAEWSPSTSADGFVRADGQAWSTTGESRMRCAIHLPDGATITQVGFQVNDTSATGTVSGCGLISTADFAPVANALATDVSSYPATPGVVTVTDDTIDPATFDNARAWSLFCDIDGTGSSVSIRAGWVLYEVTGLPIL